MPTLTIQLPGLPPVSHVLKDETITIGRLKSNSIVIEDSSISLMHAKITRKDGEFFLKDLNSTNGTIVNGQPIGEVRLRDQDRVRFADITTQFVAEASATAPQAAFNPAPVVPAPQIAQPSGIPTRPPSLPSAPARSRPRVRTLAMAAGILIVVLPGLGMVGWKFLAPNRQETQLSSPASSSKKLLVSEGASQVTPARAMVEAKPVSALSETPAVPALNITDLLAALKSKDVAERRQAASALHGAGAEAKEAIPALRAALKDSDEEVQMWAALALVNTQTYDKAIIPILVRALKNDNTVLRQVACLSLGLIPYESGDKGTIVPALTEAAVNDKDEDVRQAAKSALSIVAPEAPESAAVK